MKYTLVYTNRAYKDIKRLEKSTKLRIGSMVIKLKIYTEKNQKNIVHVKCASLCRFNEWELKILEKPDSEVCLAGVFELYDMIPEQARQRPVNVEGIQKMREGLACLT